MRQRSLGWILGSVAVVGVALGACGGSDSSGPSGISCTAGSPNLAGTWTLDTLDFVGNGGVDPGATGSFDFTGENVDVTLNITGGGSITGAGKCTLTVTKQTVDTTTGKLYINSTGTIGQASGTYTYVTAAPKDTLRASLVSTGNTIRVVVTR